MLIIKVKKKNVGTLGTLLNIATVHSNRRGKNKQTNKQIFDASAKFTVFEFKQVTKAILISTHLKRPSTELTLKRNDFSARVD